MGIRNRIVRMVGIAGLIAVLGSGASTVLGAEPSTKPSSFETLAEQLVQRAKGNPYLEDRIKSILQQLAKELDEGQLRTQLLNTTTQELLRGIEKTKQGDYILAVDYGIDWEGTDFTPYLMANLKAADRGVQITRIFIISGDTPKAELCHAMTRQQQAGIKVRVAKKNALAGHPEYEGSKAARVIFHYQHKHAVLMIETIPLPDLRLGELYLLDVLWDKRKIEDSIRYIDWLIDGKRSEPFDPRACAR